MMRCVFLACLAALLASPVHAAKWVKVGSVDGADTYVDRAGIRPVKDQYKAWTLVSHASEQVTADGMRYRSLKALHQFSCHDRTVALLSQTYYPQPMGKGPMLQHIRYEKFAAEAIPSGSPSESALKLVCAAKPRAR
jgi:hypothetical protein